MYILFIATILMISFHSEAKKRFEITNEVGGNQFKVERDELGKMEPEWGFDKREIRCDAVPDNEKDRVVSKRTEKSLARAEPAVDLCTLKPQFTIVETDMAKEIEEKAAKEKGKKDRRESLKALKGKDLTPDEVKSAVQMMIDDLAGE